MLHRSDEKKRQIRERERKVTVIERPLRNRKDIEKRESIQKKEGDNQLA